VVLSFQIQPTVYDALPAMLINSATNSRVDSGYRLLERCVRHSHDPRMQSLFDSKADVIQLLDGSVGFRIAAQVPASMKSSVYSAAVVHTTQDILSAECGCKSGSKGDDKVVCVHILPIMNKLTHLMYEGLAEHILIELSSSYACLRENWTNDVSVSVKDSVFILMEAAGDTVSTFTQSYDLYVPKGEGSKSTMCQETDHSRGSGRDRMVRRQLEELNNSIERNQNRPYMKPSKSNRRSIAAAENDAVTAAADAAESRKAVMQIAEVTANESSSIKINPSVAVAAGVAYDDRYLPPVKTPDKRFFNSSPRHSDKTPSKKNLSAEKPPIITLGTSDSEIKRRTGFPTEAAMLSYIIVVCGGSIDLIRQRSSSLTWYEEWVFHFEWKYGRTFQRWLDASKLLGPHPHTLRSIIRQKLKLERRIHSLWPKFVSYDEDCALRKPKWDLKYGERNGNKTRVIMWDMTGVKSYQFGAATVQQDTYSKYYASNCFKGGIFTQLCGWGGVHELWGGNVSDSNYNELAGYLDEQWEFQKKDLVDGRIVPFTNIYDKGYRARGVCFRKGRQLVAQPI
jgi:hypothetical protein